MKSHCLFSLAVAILTCGAYAQEKPRAVTVRTIAPVTSTKKQADAKKGAGTGGYSQAAADRWRATQAAAVMHKGSGSEAGEVHKTTKTGIEGVSVKQRKGWVYTGHVRRPHTDAK